MIKDVLKQNGIILLLIYLYFKLLLVNAVNQDVNIFH